MKHLPFFLIGVRPVVLIILLASWLPRSAPAQTPLYEAEYIGALPGEVDSHTSAINARGQIVGLSPTYPSRAFVYTDGAVIVELFGPNGNTWVRAHDINDLGIVVGKSWDNGVPAHAVRWTAGVPEDLGSIGETARAAALNIDGFIVGNTMIGSDQKAYRYTDGTGMELIAPEHFQSGVSDVNAAGQAVGSFTVYNAWHAYRFTPGVGVEDLGVIDGFLQSTGSATNISGQVAGTVTSATGNISRVYRYTDGVGSVLLGGYGGSVTGMNARGDCVGTGYPTPAGIERAFVYTDDAGMQDLELLVEWPTSDHYRLLYGTDINDAGQIAGVAFKLTTSSRGRR